MRVRMKLAGAHVFKVGFTHNAAAGRYPTWSNQDMQLRMSSGQPFQVSLLSTPREARFRINHDLGLYAQDQWRSHRLTAIELTDYTAFTIINPVDGQPLTLYNLLAAKRGQTQNLRTFAPNDREVFNGVDLTMSGRVHRATLTGGISTGRSATRTCTADDPNLLRFCEVTPPFLTQYKLLGVYPLRLWDLQLSGAFQSLPGPLITADYTVTSAIAGVTLTNGSIATKLVQPGTMYGERLNQTDVRVAKSVRFGQRRVQAMVDLFNVFNRTPVTRVNTTYGPNWQRPQAMLTGRFVKLGAQVDF